MVFLLPLPEEKSSDLREPAMQGRARIRRFPLGQCSKIEESPWESRRRNPGRARPPAGSQLLWLRWPGEALTFLRRSAPSSFLLLLLLLVHRVLKNPRATGAASCVEARGGRARLLRGPGARSRLPTPRPCGIWPHPREEGARLLATGWAASFVCLIPQHFVSLKLTPIGIQGSPPPHPRAPVRTTPAPHRALNSAVVRRVGSTSALRSAPRVPAGGGTGCAPQPPSPALAA